MNNQLGKRTYLEVGERRQQLLDSAVAVMIEDGVSALSLRTVAHRADVAHRVVTYAFGSKAALVSALLQRESRRLVEQSWSEPLLDVPLGPAVAAALRALIEQVRANPRLHECLAELAVTARATPALLEAAQAEAEAYRGDIVARVEEWCRIRGTELLLPIGTVAAALQAAAGGVVDWWLSTRDDALVEPIIDVFAAGFAEMPHAPVEGRRP